MITKIRQKMYYVGLVLLFVGALGLTLGAFLSVFFLPIFMLGLILVLISTKTWKQKLIPIGIFITPIVLFWSIWISIKNGDPEVFLISHDYRGKISVIYNR